ncbi:methyltranserase [Plasmodium cynomolgi strain B]|uniref:Methyltranserase n=1 Tax=Plasmodium cynomolgi (strain B) TaxID=1120755 RepID=K6VIT1_PLACD|nr:methyltranserase [Plasmodium cynomolgi strain B]GAB69297.1 methyltranserase [Plasmodium cynomolgi strain B]
MCPLWKNPISKLTNVISIKNLCAEQENPFLLQIRDYETSEKKRLCSFYGPLQICKSGNMRPFFDSDIVVNFTLSEEAVQNEKKIIESNRRVLRECQKEKLISEGKKNWDKFYHHYKTNFFKDRKWIRIEFDHIFRGETSIDDEQTGDAMQDGGEGATQVESTKEKKLVLEIGCGVGNTLIPLLMQYEHLNCVGIDFSKNAINLLNEKWNRVVSLNEQLKGAASEGTSNGCGNEVCKEENNGCGNEVGKEANSRGGNEVGKEENNGCGNEVGKEANNRGGNEANNRGGNEANNRGGNEAKRKRRTTGRMPLK